eukprot:2612865-Amphidinium_carterae.3
MIEPVAPVLVQCGMPDVVTGRRLSLMVESEASLGALVKGYSNRIDVCDLAVSCGARCVLVSRWGAHQR